MRKRYTLFSLFIILIFSLQVNSQKFKPEVFEYRYWIYFKDKGEFKSGVTLQPGTDAYELAKSDLTDKALWRRSKVLPEDKLVTYDDIPVNIEYIDEIKSIGLNPNAVSKWLNAVSVHAAKDKLDKVKKLGFVEKIEGVHYLEFAKLPESRKIKYVTDIIPVLKLKYNYGISYWQNEQIKVPELHNYGVTGFGVTVGMCDDGFNWRRHAALKTRRVLGEYDWIFKDDSTQFQVSPYQMPGDSYDQDGHGTATMSTLGGFYEGELIGPAFDAEFYLSKTEAGETETPVEEDFWLEAVEWMEAKGVDVISCSLIYKPFDAPNNQYTYEDMNGKTTIIVRAAEHAAGLGVIVVNSMGNEYQTDPPSIVSPPDGAHVISAGAVDSAGTIAVFSSNGPTSDGRIKPDVVAMGVNVYTASSYSTTHDTAGYSFSNGTSFSAPLIAGVCALIISVHPELTPDEVKEALKKTADNMQNPNNIYGWGLVNAYDAALYYGMIMSNKPEINVLEDNTELSVYVISRNEVNKESVKMYYSIEGAEYIEEPLSLMDRTAENNSGKYSVTIPVNLNNKSCRFYFSASDSQTSKSLPFNAPQKFFYINQETKKLEIF